MSPELAHLLAECMEAIDRRSPKCQNCEPSPVNCSTRDGIPGWLHNHPPHEDPRCLYSRAVLDEARAAMTRLGWRSTTCTVRSVFWLELYPIP